MPALHATGTLGITGSSELNRDLAGAEGTFGWSVQSGAVTFSSGLTFNVAAVAAGDYTVNSVAGSVYAGGTVVLSTQDPTLPRVDIIVITAAGAVSAVAGTPKALTTTSGPVPPTPTTSQLEIARIFVPASGTPLSAASITDRRVPLSPVVAGAGFNATAGRRMVYDTTAAALKVWDGSASVSLAATLPTILTNIKDSKALLAFMDSLALTTPSTATSVGIGLVGRFDGSGTINAVTMRGGGFDLRTGATGNSQAQVAGTVGGGGSAGVGAYADRNPYAAFILTSRATSAALKAQGWGFSAETEAGDIEAASNYDRALFRSITTGNLFASTKASGVAETTTDLGAFHTLGTAGVFEVYTTDDGVTWIFKIDGVVRATHTTSVPVVTTSMGVTCTIENNTTTDLRITNIDLIYAYCDRT